MNYIWLKNENNEDFDISASKLISSITEVPELLKIGDFMNNNDENYEKL